MGDYNLTLLPQSKIRFRLGYSRNVNEGPSFSSLHQGTEALLLQNYEEHGKRLPPGRGFQVFAEDQYQLRPDL